jgi:hypothetical protein
MMANGGEQMGVRSIEHRDWTLQILYESYTDNILTMDNIRRIEEIEIEVLRMPEFKNFCMARSLTDTACNDNLAFLSFTIIVKGYYRQPSLDNINQQMLLDLMDVLTNSETSWPQYRSFFDNGTNKDNPYQSKWLRSIFYGAGPLEIDGVRYKSIQDRTKEQQLKVAEFHAKIEERLTAEFSNEYFETQPASRAYL